MSRIYLPLILFLLLVLQGVAVDLLPRFLVSGQTFIISHWVFVILIYITIYYDDNLSFNAVVYGVIFGLLIDIVYTNVLGVYMFTYRSEEHTSELQSRGHLVCRLLLEKKTTE